jgi:hypothetical protein
MRTASGGLPSIENASAATTPAPRARRCEENSIRFHGAINDSQMWNASGCVLLLPQGSSLAASFCRSTDSRRIAGNIASAVPLLIQ